MSSSSSPASPAVRRVLRPSGPASIEAPGALLSLDLARDGLERFDPCRIEEAVAEGYAAGLRAGTEAGHEEARRAAATELQQVSAAHGARLAAIVATSEVAIRDLVATVLAAADAAATATAGAAFSIAEAVVGRELELATDPVRDAVARALAIAPEGMGLTLRLHPTDAEELDAASLPPGRAIAVVPDTAVARGDCVVDAGWTRIDARIGEALDRVRSVLEGTT